MYYDIPPIWPRNEHTLVVGVVARISGGPNQKELSLDDQIDHAKQVVGLQRHRPHDVPPATRNSSQSNKAFPNCCL
jgi:hypothetical protein